MSISLRETDACLCTQANWLSILSSISDAIITTDGRGRILFLNPAAESLMDCSSENAVGQPLELIAELINEGTREPIVVPAIEALREGGNGLECRYLLVAKDGSEHSISDSTAPIRNLAGECTGIVFVLRDITDRRKAERDLEKSLQYADDIIATLREPFVVLDADLRVRTANRSFYDSFQVSEEETESQFVYELGNGQWDIPGLRKLLDEVLSRNHPVLDFEIKHTFPALGLKTMLLNARPFPPESKHPELILLAMQDVSELREWADNLVEANRCKDAFLAMLAHELRNPLAPIGNAVQYLSMDGLETSEVKTASDLIGRQVSIMVRLIEDLMDVSRISRNTLNIRKQPVELAAIVEMAIETSRPLIEEASHTLTVSLPPDPLHLDADPIRLAQVLSNLLNNAAKYTKPGGHIRLAAQRTGSKAVVSVQDNGAGIPSDMLGRVFDMFTQVEETLEHSQGGLGIGLALVRRLVEMHDGSIEAHSDGAGQGSTFIVRLPCAQPLHELPPSDTSIEVPSVRGCRILVVDDNRDSASTLEMLLRLGGNTVRTAYDGQEAIEVAEEFCPELLLLDIGLPKLNGYDVARHIRKQPWGRDITLVAVTGWGQAEDKRRSHEAGFDFHVVKPVELAALGKLLEERCESK